MSNAEAIMQGYLLLREAIYNRAVLDYYAALIDYDDGRKKEIEEFLKSEFYYVNEKVGQYIISKAKRELELVEVFVDEFFASEKSSIFIDPSEISTDCIGIYVRHRFPNNLKLQQKSNDKLFLVLKKPLKMA